MNYRWRHRIVLPSILALALLVPAFESAAAENVDPNNDGSELAYGQNIGWLNAEPQGNGGPGLQVNDFNVTGYLWSGNGWISCSCENTSSCASVDYGVRNDGNGVLTGYAWGENIGWVSFSCQNTGSCGTVSYGVTVDASTGDFSGRAWSENAGWITFADAGAIPYKVQTSWNCNPAPAAPSGAPQLSVEKLGTVARLSWGGITGDTGDEIVHGDLAALRGTGGDFSAATTQCLDDNRTSATLDYAPVPAPGNAEWFLVRGVNCGGSGTYDSLGPSQAGSRDAEIAASGNACP